jgi:hypothetical protein
MTYSIYMAKPNDFRTFPTYLYTTKDWFSSDFDSLEQLMDVGLDDPDKVDNIKADEYLISYPDIIHLCDVDKLEDLYNYPELFI